MAKFILATEFTEKKRQALCGEPTEVATPWIGCETTRQQSNSPGRLFLIRPRTYKMFSMQNISSIPPQIINRIALFPDSTRVENNMLFIAGQELASLAERYGTPLYVYDRATLEASVKAYTEASHAGR